MLHYQNILNSTSTWLGADISHKHLLLKYRRYGKFRCEESQVLKSVGCIRTAGLAAHHQERADEHTTTLQYSVNNNNTHG